MEQKQLMMMNYSPLSSKILAKGLIGEDVFLATVAPRSNDVVEEVIMAAQDYKPYEDKA